MITANLIKRLFSSNSDRLKTIVYSVLQLFGIDRAIAYTLAGRIWSLASGPLTLVLIAKCLRPDEQGFYYTFGSLISLNILFELGLTYVLLQFASHEKAHLEWTPQGVLAGSTLAWSRLAAMLQLAMRWYAVAAALILLFILPAGLVFFSKNSGHNAAVAWQIPWIWLAVVSALNFLVSPLLAVLEGCGKVAQVAQFRACQNILSSLGLWLTLVCHGALFAGPVLQTLNVVASLFWLITRYGSFFRSLLQADVANVPFHWLTEVWPFQWRIAVSWFCGYFVFQLFNPVLFAQRGPVEAGQMGMSLSLCAAVGGIAMTWMSTKAAPFGVLVAQRDYERLDQLFFKALSQSAIVLGCGGGLLFLVVFLLSQIGHSFAIRFLRPLPFSLLICSTLLNHFVFCQAQYLRTHKQEPFLWVSVVGAFLTAASTYLLAKPYGGPGVAAGCLATSLVGLIVATFIFRSKRRAWHEHWKSDISEPACVTAPLRH